MWNYFTVPQVMMNVAQSVYWLYDRHRHSSGRKFELKFGITSYVKYDRAVSDYAFSRLYVQFCPIAFFLFTIHVFLVYSWQCRLWKSLLSDDFGNWMVHASRTSKTSKLGILSILASPTTNSEQPLYLLCMQLFWSPHVSINVAQ